ncbi:MAG: nucleoside 2-deoxyribosyltransferase [candidate division KSB1 bacterium]|nr:nucleoside 2-deoxyribosyltransferase [candidate division KSB1 bacterium]MDZ7367438.1 nucleoside 2-deoxyribosyltransferase [candidate division KSB1 bacterium]MDZ7405457.1 nucleoside 2-deoxyribosyltransferase [candidate division KSB1 bacterium]
MMASSLKIYFAGAISAGRERQVVYAEMVDFLESLGAEVLSAHVARADVLEYESTLQPEEIFQRDMQFIANCDGMIAEVSRPSLGVGYEIATALTLWRPTLCLCEQGTFLTRMLTGNPHERLQIHFYRETDEWQEAIREFHRHLRDANSAPLYA